MIAFVRRGQSEPFARRWSETEVFLHQVGNEKIHYPPKVKGAQMANLHCDVATTGGLILSAQFLTQFSVKREKHHYDTKC